MYLFGVFAPFFTSEKYIVHNLIKKCKVWNVGREVGGMDPVWPAVPG